MANKILPSNRHLLELFPRRCSPIQQIAPTTVVATIQPTTGSRIAKKQTDISTTENPKKSSEEAIVVEDAKTNNQITDKVNDSVYAVEFVCDSNKVTNVHQRAQKLVAEEVFATVVENQPEQIVWLKELFAEAKPLLTQILLTAPQMKAELRSTEICIPASVQNTIPNDNARETSACNLSQNLMHTVISELFDRSSMSEMSVDDMQTPYPLLSSEGAKFNECIELASSLTANEFFTSSGSIMEKCSAGDTTAANRTEAIVLGRNVVSFTFDKNAGPKESDEYFYNLIDIMHHFEWINRNPNSPFCVCCGFIMKHNCYSTKKGSSHRYSKY